MTRRAPIALALACVLLLPACARGPVAGVAAPISGRSMVAAGEAPTPAALEAMLAAGQAALGRKDARGAYDAFDRATRAVSRGMRDEVLDVALLRRVHAALRKAYDQARVEPAFADAELDVRLLSLHRMTLGICADQTAKWLKGSWRSKNPAIIAGRAPRHALLRNIVDLQLDVALAAAALPPALEPQAGLILLHSAGITYSLGAQELTDEQERAAWLASALTGLDRVNASESGRRTGFLEAFEGVIADIRNAKLRGIPQNGPQNDKETLTGLPDDAPSPAAFHAAEAALLAAMEKADAPAVVALLNRLVELAVGIEGDDGGSLYLEKAHAHVMATWRRAKGSGSFTRDRLDDKILRLAERAPIRRIDLAEKWLHVLLAPGQARDAARIARAHADLRASAELLLGVVRTIAAKPQEVNEHGGARLHWTVDFAYRASAAHFTDEAQREALMRQVLDHLDVLRADEAERERDLRMAGRYPAVIAAIRQAPLRR